MVKGPGWVRPRAVDRRRVEECLDLIFVELVVAAPIVIIHDGVTVHRGGMSPAAAYSIA